MLEREHFRALAKDGAAHLESLLAHVYAFADYQVEITGDTDGAQAVLKHITSAETFLDEHFRSKNTSRRGLVNS